MFKNIGRKIKVLAKVLCWIGIIASIIASMVIFSTYYGDIAVLIGLSVLISGILISWVGSFFVYGYGELIENSKIIAESLNQKHTANKYNLSPEKDSVNTRKIESHIDEPYYCADEIHQKYINELKTEELKKLYDIESVCMDTDHGRWENSTFYAQRVFICNHCNCIIATEDEIY